MGVRTLFAFEMTTVDGLFEGAKPWSLAWHNVDAEFGDFAVDQLRQADILLFGRRTYEGMVAYWPSSTARANDPEVARLMNETPKVVFSSTLEAVEWESARLVGGEAADEVRRLKGQAGRDIAILGSCALTASLLRQGLVDEVRVMVNPIILGSGNRLFAGVEGALPLRLRRTQAFNSGNVLLCYDTMAHTSGRSAV